MICFNEAPAVRGGKVLPRRRQVLPRAASMRPPQFAGERDGADREDVLVVAASMRPPQFAGERREDATIPDAPTVLLQ